jgi:hypothetical protein
MATAQLHGTGQRFRFSAAQKLATAGTVNPPETFLLRKAQRFLTSETAQGCTETAQRTSIT